MDQLLTQGLFLPRKSQTGWSNRSLNPLETTKKTLDSELPYVGQTMTLGSRHAVGTRDVLHDEFPTNFQELRARNT